MFKQKTHRTVAGLVLGVACLAAPCLSSAASLLPVAGAITGVVNDNLGVPQMGATVLLMNRQDRPILRAQTDSRGEFRFAGLLPDSYSLRITLASFLPAFKRDVLVQPGMRSIL